MTRQTDRRNRSEGSAGPPRCRRPGSASLAALLFGAFFFLSGIVAPALAAGAGATEPGPEGTRPEGTASLSASANSGLGPLLVQSHAFFQLLRLGMSPWMAPPLDPGTFELQSSVTWVNLWGWKPGRYLVDGEVARVSWAFCYGVSRRLQVRFEVPFTLRTGGLLDKPIEGFHDTFGYVQAGRDVFPRNRFRVVFYPPGGGDVRLDDSDTGLDAGDLTLAARWAVFEGTAWLPAVGLCQSLKIPAGQNEGGGVDGALGLSLSKRIWKGYAYFGLQYTRFGASEILGVSMRPEQWSFLFCLEAPLSERFSLLVQDLTQTGAARNFYAFSRATHEVAAGFKYRFRPGALLEFGIIENLVNYDNSPDIGVHVGLSWRFG